MGGRHESVMDLEHGKLPDPFSEAVRLILEEQTRMGERLKKLEESCGITAEAGDLSMRIGEIEKAFINEQEIQDDKEPE